VIALSFAFTLNTPLLAQQQQQGKEKDIAEFSLEELLNVEITTAGKKAEKISDIPASVVVITRADIEKYGYQSLDEILENVPGLYGINQRDAAGMVFGVRGFYSASANSITTLINGDRLERIASDGGIYPAVQVPVESIDRIEVIRGPMSVIYGTGAFFGAINIITNDTNPGNPSLASVSYGNLKTGRASVRASINKEDLKAVFNAGLYDTEGPNEPYSKMTSMDISWLTTKTTTKGRYMDRYKFFNISVSYKGFYANALYNHDKKGLDVFFISGDKGARANRTYSLFSFGYTKEFSKKVSIDGKITYHKGDTTGNWDWFTPPGGLNLYGDNNFREDYEVDLTAFINPSSVFNFTAGIYYKRIIHEQLLSNVPGIVEYQIGLLKPAQTRAMFIQADITASENLKFVLGVRFDQAVKYSAYWTSYSGGAQFTGNFEHDKIEVLPRVALIFKLDKKNILKFFYGKAINHPSIYQTGAQAASGQDPLNPEFIQTFEFNYLAAISEKFSVNTSFFYNNLDKLIVNDPYIQSGTWIGRNLNSGKYRTTGAELSIRTKPVHQLDLELSGTYQKTKDKRPGYENITVAYSPEFLGYIKSAFSFTKDIVLSANLRYIGPMETYWDKTISGRIASRVKEYFLVGANLRFDDLFKKGFYLNFACYNLFNKEYLFPTFTLNSWADKGLIGNPRLFMATFGKKF